MEFTVCHPSSLTPEKTDFSCVECSHEGTDTRGLSHSLLAGHGTSESERKWLKIFSLKFRLFQSLGQEDPLEKGMATHSNILALRIPWTEERGRLQSTGSQRIKHDWATYTFTFQERKEYFTTPSVCPAYISQCIFHSLSDQVLRLRWKTWMASAGSTCTHCSNSAQQLLWSHPSSKGDPGSPRPIHVTRSLYQSDWQRYSGPKPVSTRPQGLVHKYISQSVQTSELGWRLNPDSLNLDGVVGKYKAIAAALTWPFREPKDKVITPKRHNQVPEKQSRCPDQTMPKPHPTTWPLLFYLISQFETGFSVIWN